MTANDLIKWITQNCDGNEQVQSAIESLIVG